MPKYILAYHGGGAMAQDEAAQAKTMEAWMGWFGSLGAAVVDGGNPVGRSMTVSKAGVAEGGGAAPLTGYSMLEAANMDAAVAMAKGCPTLADGGSVQVGETFDAG